MGVVVVSQTQTAGVSHRPSSVSAAPLWLPCGVERKRRVGAGGRTARAPGGAVRLSSTSRPSVRPSVLVVGVGACFVCLCFGAISLRSAVRSHFSPGGVLTLLVGLLRVPCRHYETLIARFTRYSIHGIWLSLPFLFVSLSLLSAPRWTVVTFGCAGHRKAAVRPCQPVAVIVQFPCLPVYVPAPRKCS